MTKKTQFGKLSPLYNFFLNPYEDARFSRCPQCEVKTGQKKVPLVIHVDPYYPLILNYTCRYCAKCDLLIAHKNEIEGHLTQVFAQRAPEALGNDYLVLGTAEKEYWRDGVNNPHPPSELLDNLHGFKEYRNFELIGGWMTNEDYKKALQGKSPSGSVDNPRNSEKLVEKMKANLPISVRAGKELLKILRKQGFPISDRQTLFIKSVFYGGDEMGIACDITPPGKHKQVVVCSLTQLEIIGKSALLDETRTYQEVRKKKLAQLPDSVTGGITIKRR
ncbi:MAG: hypothetical protein AB1564_02165 [Chloroflexota bacterium]